MTLVAPSAAGYGTDLDQSLAARSSLPKGPPDGLRPSDAEVQLARGVIARWDEGQRIVADRRRSYWTNLAFYLGHQWSWWSEQRGMVMPLSSSFSPLGKPGGAKLIVNRFGPNLSSVLNRLTKAELAFEVPPSDSADNIVGGAKLSEKVLETKARDDRWDAIRFDENLAKLLGGTSAVSIEWDGRAGVALPNFDWQSDQFVGTGDARIRSHNISEFIIEPGVRMKSDARYWISALAIPVGTAQEHYNLNWIPRADADSPAQGSLYDSLLEGSGRKRGDNLCMVYTYYERPFRGSPGMYTVVVNGVAIYKGDWPFPFPELNIETFRQKPIDGRWYGATFCDDAVPIQTAYNYSRSVMQEWMKKIANVKLAAPIGSFDEEDLHGPSGDILWYSPDGTGSVPAYTSLPNAPRWMADEPDKLREEIDNVMHMSDVSRGIGFSRATGQGLSFLAEQADAPLGHMVLEEKHGWEGIARKFLMLCGAKVTETREASVYLDKTVTEKIRWTGRELQGQTDVVVPLEAVTPRNAAARLANAQSLWDRKIITDPRRYARMVGLPPDEFGQLLDPDAAKANGENLRMMIGQPCLPDDFDDHAVHIAEHNDRLRKTDSYYFAPPEIKSIIDDHIKYHENKAANEQARQRALAQASATAPSVPQASAPPGSDVPQGEQEQMARAGAMAALGASPDGSALGGASPAQQAAAPPPALPPGGGA